MGKVKDGTSASKPPKGTQVAQSKRRLAPFFANLFRASLYKPKQGRLARRYTEIALGVILAIGLWRLHETLYSYEPAIRLGVPVAVGLVLGWLTFRLMQFPPFVEFLIATEAEMNKVSWTSREDLQRATIVVLVTMFCMAFYLFGVDYLWSALLQIVGVLKFSGESLGNQ
jgi:preprotein translocase subunit SecE